MVPRRVVHIWQITSAVIGVAHDDETLRRGSGRRENRPLASWLNQRRQDRRRLPALSEIVAERHQKVRSFRRPAGVVSDHCFT